MKYQQWRRLLSAALVVAVMMGMAGCSTIGKPVRSGQVSIGQSEFRELVVATEAIKLIQENRNNENFVILDVRTPEEFEAGHIANAININYRCPMFRAKAGKLDRSKQYAVYCRGGVRSSMATEILQEMEFKYLYDISSGTIGWVAAKLPFEGENIPPPPSKEEPKIDAGSHKIDTASGIANVPFEVIEGHLTLDVSIAGQKLKFAFEPGMPSAGALLYGGPQIDDLSLAYVGKAMVSKGGTEPVMAELAQGLTFSIGELELNQQSVIVMPPNPENEDSEIDGLIGFSILDKFVVEIDYENSVVRLTEPGAFNYSGSGKVLPLIMTEIGIPRLDVEITQMGENPFQAELNLGLAGPEPLILNAGKFENISIPDNALEKDGRRIASVPSLQFGDLQFDNVVTAFEPDTETGSSVAEAEGHISFQSLPCTRIFVDYTGKQFILETL